MNKAIEFRHVSFSYDDENLILDDVNCEINYHKLTLLAGHSGCGKSTFLSIISGIIPNINYGVLKGEVILNNNSIKEQKVSQICRQVGVVLQNADEQIIQKYVEDEIAFGCENLGFNTDKIRRQVELVCKLLDLNKNAECRKLSGGQKQKLIIASTLAMGQKILILDEPLANLDKDTSLQLMMTLKELTKSGYAVIIVEHRIDIVLPFADTILYLNNKKIEEVSNKEIFLKRQSKQINDICPITSSIEPILTLQNVSYNVKKQPILKNLQYTFKKGKRTVILGENGCGKTTLLNLLAKLLIPSEGFIKQNIDNKLKQKKRGDSKWFKKVGVIYQNPDYQLFMPTVKKELYFASKNDNYAEEIARRFELLELLDKHPQSLSEGQKRRLSIACILASQPDVVLLDEPTVGQDYEFLLKLITNLNEIHLNTNNTMITITHDIRCAKSLCDDAILIENHHIKKIGGKELVDEYFQN